MDAKVIIPQNIIDSEIESLFTGDDGLPMLGGNVIQTAETLRQLSRKLRAASYFLSIYNADVISRADDVARRYATLSANLMDKTALSDL